eukprot:TRINITY_DN2185_c0_g1_i1.p1 TRINITY_DN2185_c0_g1~~TRINITY_DN2185_c0_g1_i1.p1  ORF type:complete len:228 (+),score=58.09 TRINITY_DN2185_c0_g1_i1:61-744(+)
MDDQKQTQAPQKTLAAAVIGGTGAIGRKLVDELVASPNFHKITTFGRRKVDNFPNSDKIEQVVIDLDKMEEHKDKLAGHDVGFCCLGTTLADAGSDEAFRKVDFGYVTKFAELSKQAGINRFHLVSSTGANSKSWLVYFRTKAEADEKVMSLGFQSTCVYRPGLLDRGESARLKEKIFSWFTTAISVDIVGKAMRIQAETEGVENVSGSKIFENKEILQTVKWFLSK